MSGVSEFIISMGLGTVLLVAVASVAAFTWGVVYGGRRRQGRK